MIELPSDYSLIEIDEQQGLVFLVVKSPNR